MVFLSRGEVCGPHGGKSDWLAKTCFQAQNHFFLTEWYEETDWSFYVLFSPEMQHAWVTTLRELCEVKNPTCISNAVNWQTSALILIITEKKNLQSSLQGAEQRLERRVAGKCFLTVSHSFSTIVLGFLVVSYSKITFNWCGWLLNSNGSVPKLDISSCKLYQSTAYNKRCVFLMWKRNCWCRCMWCTCTCRFKLKLIGFEFVKEKFEVIANNWCWSNLDHFAYEGIWPIQEKYSGHWCMMKHWVGP
jgi:hypothetical protein